MGSCRVMSKQATPSSCLGSGINVGIASKPRFKEQNSRSCFADGGKPARHLILARLAHMCPTHLSRPIGRLSGQSHKRGRLMTKYIYARPPHFQLPYMYPAETKRLGRGVRGTYQSAVETAGLPCILLSPHRTCDQARAYSKEPTEKNKIQRTKRRLRTSVHLPHGSDNSC